MVTGIAGTLDFTETFQYNFTSDCQFRQFFVVHIPARAALLLHLPYPTSQLRLDTLSKYFKIDDLDERVICELPKASVERRRSPEACSTP